MWFPPSSYINDLPPGGNGTWQWVPGSGGGGGGSSSAGNTQGVPEFSDPDNHCDVMDKFADAWGKEASKMPYGPVLPTTTNTWGAEKLNFIGFGNDGSPKAVGDNYWLVPHVDRDTGALYGSTVSPPSGVVLGGFIHNHPSYTSISYKTATGEHVPTGQWRENTEEENLINRYPSPEDWNTLTDIHNRNAALGVLPSQNNPSMYIMDPFGTVREFKYSYKAIFSDMSVSSMVSGEGIGSLQVNTCRL